MNFISTKVHGVQDYLIGIFLIISPWVLDFTVGGVAQWLPVFIGFLILALSVFTQYELGLIRLIRMKVHLTTDLIVGAVLAASPWIFQFADQVYWPHLIVGLLIAGVSIVSSSVPTISKPI